MGVRVAALDGSGKLDKLPCHGRLFESSKPDKSRPPPVSIAESLIEEICPIPH